MEGVGMKNKIIELIENKKGRYMSEELADEILKEVYSSYIQYMITEKGTWDWIDWLERKVKEEQEYVQGRGIGVKADEPDSREKKLGRCIAVKITRPENYR